MADITKEQVIDWLSSQTVLEVADLVKQLEEKWGVSAAAPVAVAAAAAGGSAPAEAAEEKGGGVGVKAQNMERYKAKMSELKAKKDQMNSQAVKREEGCQVLFCPIFKTPSPAMDCVKGCT